MCQLVRERGIRSAVWVPEMRDGTGLGAIGVARTEPGGFADEQIALLETFAERRADLGEERTGQG